MQLVSKSFLHFLSVRLDAPDTVLIERAVGKRVDPRTGGKYLILHLRLPEKGLHNHIKYMLTEFRGPINWSYL